MDKPKPNFGGVAAVADMLNHMDAADRERLLAEVAKRDPALATQIKDQLFTFAGLARLDDRSMQILLRGVPQSVLAVALRSAPEDLKAAVFRNLSVRTAEALREEMAASPPRKISDVHAAQSAIVAIAKTLIASTAGR